MRKCDKCDFAGYTQNRLNTHIKSVHLPKEFKCDQCDYETTQNSILKAHIMQAHTMERPYKCDQCDYAGATAVLLSTHKDCFQQIGSVVNYLKIRFERYFSISLY